MVPTATDATRIFHIGLLSLSVGQCLLTRSGIEDLSALQRDGQSTQTFSNNGVILLDLHLPGIGGLELLRRLLGLSPNSRVVVFSMHAETMYAARALKAGAHGYVSKNASPEELQIALHRVIEGGRYVESDIAKELAVRVPIEGDPWNRLTERNLEILRLLSEGRSLTQIVTAIGISYKTVANICTRIKANSASRAQPIWCGHASRWVFPNDRRIFPVGLDACARLPCVHADGSGRLDD